jgi:hypothetical protein
LLAQRKWCDERIVTRYSCQRIGLQMRLVIRLCSVLWIALASLPIRAVAAAATPVRQSFDISVPFKPSASACARGKPEIQTPLPSGGWNFRLRTA